MYGPPSDCKGKSEGWIDRSAQMYSAFVWRANSPGHDELRCVLFLINGTAMEDHFREQVASTPLGTVRSSLLSGADLVGTLDRGAVRRDDLDARHAGSCPIVLSVDRTAQAMRARLLAAAVITTLIGARCSSASSQP